MTGAKILIGNKLLIMKLMPGITSEMNARTIKNLV
ncbi:hypothetical protein MXB_3580 [Myxobolus squamalis]|nr:hypothetical protein MXB_3580 [Myxobolus squamalis]